MKNYREYLNMIRQDLRDLINKHKPIERLNNNNADTNNNNNNNNNDDDNFQNALGDALNYQTIETDPERISKLKPYINKYNWKGIEFPAGSKEWQKFEQNNKTIAKISVVYKSKRNKREKQVILLMTGDGKKYYLAVTSLSALLKKVSSNHKKDFYCLNCFNSYTTKSKLKEHEKYVIIMIVVV